MINTEGQNVKVELKGICKTCKHWGQTKSNSQELKDMVHYYFDVKKAIQSLKNELQNGSCSESEFCSNEKNQVTTKHVNWGLFVAGGIPTSYEKHEPIKTDKNWYCPLWELRQPKELTMSINDWLEIKHPNKKFNEKQDSFYSYKTEGEFDAIVKEVGLKDKGFFG